MYLYFCMKWWLQLFCSQLQILPAPTAPLIVDKSNVAKGLSSRFLWIFLKPVFKPFLAIEVPTNKYEGLSPPTSCFKFCYEEHVCYHFPSNFFSYIKIQPKLEPTEYNLGTQNWNWVNKREFRTSQQSETEILYSKQYDWNGTNSIELILGSQNRHWVNKTEFRTFKQNETEIGVTKEIDDVSISINSVFPMSRVQPE